MKIAISAESTMDLQGDLLEKFNIHTTPFSILLGDDLKKDGEIEPQDIFDYVKATKSLPKTSAVNEEQFKEHFENILKDYDAVIHFSLSSGMSCAYANAVNASKDFDNIYVVDTLTLSTGIALLAIYASQCVEQGMAYEDIIASVEKRKHSVQSSFILRDLNYLCKGGRCSALKMFGANLLKIRPQILVENGTMRPGKKFKGNMHKCILEYVDETLKECATPDLSTAFITFSSADDETVDSVREILVERGFEHIYVTHANATVCSHCGEYCFGILYINDAE